MCCKYVGCKCDVRPRICGHVHGCPNRGEVLLHVYYLFLLQTRLVWVVIAATPPYHWCSQCVCLIHLEVLKKLMDVSLLV